METGCVLRIEGDMSMWAFLRRPRENLACRLWLVTLEGLLGTVGVSRCP